MARRTYSGPLAGVSYDGAVCSHAGECVRGMPLVFDTEARPWINPDRATTADLLAEVESVVARCPSGALQMEPASTDG